MILWTLYLYLTLLFSIVIYGIILCIFRQNKKGWPCAKRKTKEGQNPKQVQEIQISIEMQNQSSLIPNENENQISEDNYKINDNE